MKIILFVMLLAFTWAKPNPAPYIHQSGRPLNIAHRGLCSILPENTLEAFESALYQGADFIELDVVYTKDKDLLVMHDPFLTRITNIRNKTEFATRYLTREYSGKNKTDWWTDSFTFNELRTLGIKQAQAPGRLEIFDFKFTMPLLSDVIEMCVAFNKQYKGARNPDGRLGGILIEAKDSQMYRDLFNREIGQDIIELLQKYGIDTIEKARTSCPIYLHSFDYETVKYWGNHSELPNHFLAGKGNKLNLTDVAIHATGVGLDDHCLWDYANHRPSDTFYEARQLGLMVHLWTFKDDVILFGAKNNIEMYNIGHNTIKLNGIITEFADIYAPLAQIWKSETFQQFPVIKSQDISLEAYKSLKTLQFEESDSNENDQQ